MSSVFLKVITARKTDWCRWFFLGDLWWWMTVTCENVVPCFAAFFVVMSVMVVTLYSVVLYLLWYLSIILSIIGIYLYICLYVYLYVHVFIYSFLHSFIFISNSLFLLYRCISLPINHLFMYPFIHKYLHLRTHTWWFTPTSVARKALPSPPLSRHLMIWYFWCWFRISCSDLHLTALGLRAPVLIQVLT